MIILDYMQNIFGEEVTFYGFDEAGAVIVRSSDPFGVWDHKTFSSLAAATNYFYKRGFRW